MNPIEMAFAKLKAPAPAASPNRRCSCRRIGELLDRFPPANVPTSSRPPDINGQCEIALTAPHLHSA
jgi:hypothetical protein